MIPVACRSANASTVSMETSTAPMADPVRTMLLLPGLCVRCIVTMPAASPMASLNGLTRSLCLVDRIRRSNDAGTGSKVKMQAVD